MTNDKAVAIRLSSFGTPQMRAFHTTWLAFFLCFFGWFGIAPLMVMVRDEFGLTKTQVGNTVIASVAITILARLLIGWLCDRVGPRLCYSALLVFGSLPVMGIGLAHDYASFLCFRLAIGVIGASFVITQYHTSQMFAPNCVGTANATTAGWGNLGGGITQMLMPLIYAGILGSGVSASSAWRLAMVVPGVLLFGMGIAYLFLTQDTPRGNFAELRARGEQVGSGKKGGSFGIAIRDARVWALFFAYAACFGVELTINNVAALYFHDTFKLSVAGAGIIAGLHGSMNIFARTLGGYMSDRVGIARGLRGRAAVLACVLFFEGVLLVIFSRMSVLPSAVACYIAFSLFVSASCGATYAIVPMLNNKALGAIAGVVGAGGNLGAVLAGLLFRDETLRANDAFLYLGFAVTAASAVAWTMRFSEREEAAARSEIAASLALRGAQSTRPVAPTPTLAGDSSTVGAAE
jgi:NNP family nitrate/nitrite transporter-like MFS transporter